MEGVGARLGRSSSRYGPAVVFSGRVRKWKKRWVHVSASRSDPPSKHSSSNNQSKLRNLNGTAANGGNGSRLLLYKWTPLSQSNNGGANGNGSGNNDPGSNGEENSEEAAEEELPRRRFKFIPIAVLEEQQNEDTENDEEDGAKASDAEESSRDDLNMESVDNNGNDEKPDINDTPMDENQEHGPSIRQDLNESTLDLSLG